MELAKSLFGADHAYVQPHSGADANLVAFWTVLTEKIQNPFLEKLGKKNLDALSIEEFERLRHLLGNQTLLGLSLSAGGHLTHGMRQNVSAKMFRSVSYGVDPVSGLLDYDSIREIARREKPLILLAGYSAYPRRINFATMRSIADEVGAVLMADMAHFAGLVAGKVLTQEEDPIPYAQIVTSTTHKTLRGPRGGLILCNKSFSETINKGCPLVLGGPLPHIIFSKAIAFREASTQNFKEYAHKIVANARFLAEALQKRGLSIVTGGTDNHLLLIDLTNLGITGRIAETALREAGLTVNRNMVPRDANGPWYTSGIRIGTPAITTLGMGQEEMREIADVLALVLKNTKPQIQQDTGHPSKTYGIIEQKIGAEAKRRVQELLKRYPLYPELDI